MSVAGYCIACRERVHETTIQCVVDNRSGRPQQLIDVGLTMASGAKRGSPADSWRIRRFFPIRAAARVRLARALMRDLIHQSHGICFIHLETPYFGVELMTREGLRR